MKSVWAVVRRHGLLEKIMALYETHDAATRHVAAARAREVYSGVRYETRLLQIQPEFSEDSGR